MLFWEHQSNKTHEHPQSLMTDTTGLGGRELLWDTLSREVCAVEAAELRHIIGNDMIDANAQLHEEWKALAAILSDLEQQNDAIRVRFVSYWS